MGECVEKHFRGYATIDTNGLKQENRIGFGIMISERSMSFASKELGNSLYAVEILVIH